MHYMQNADSDSDAEKRPGSDHIHYMQKTDAPLNTLEGSRCNHTHHRIQNDDSEKVEKNVIDFASKKPTEYKNNKRIKVPEIQDPKLEMRNNFVKEELLEVSKTFINENCKKDGTLKHMNITRGQENAIKSLKQKKNEGIIVCETDKTSRFVVDEISNVEKKMEPHYLDHKILDSAAVTKVENKLNSHTSRLVKVFRMGELCNQTRRTVGNLVTKNNPIPVLRGTQKDHKPVKDPNIGPEMRPIMGATFAPNTGLGQICCEFLKAILEDQRSSAEVKSTEEMLCQIRKYNEKRESNLANNKLKSNSELKVVGSMDIKSFYPSIRPDKVALIARHMWNRSGCSVKNVDIEKLALYVTEEIDKEKLKWLNLDQVLFKKKSVVKENDIKSVNEKKKKSFDEIWDRPMRSPTDSETKTMIGLVLENIIKIAMKNHIYQFKNEVRIQNDSGATGFDLTGLVADVFMIWWDDRFSRRLEDLNIFPDVNLRFKDDLNLLLDALPLGTKYCSKNR